MAQRGLQVAGGAPEPEEGLLVGSNFYLEMFTVPPQQRIKRMYSSFGMFPNRGKNQEGILLCRAIIAMASTLQKNLDDNNYTFNDLRNFIKLLKIIADPRFQASC